MAERFSWVVEDKIAGMERPGLYQQLQQDIVFLKDKGISVIVNLEEYFWDYPSFELLHMPVKDFQPPDLEDFAPCIEFIKQRDPPEQPTTPLGTHLPLPLYLHSKVSGQCLRN